MALSARDQIQAAYVSYATKLHTEDRLLISDFFGWCKTEKAIDNPGEISRDDLFDFYQTIPPSNVFPFRWALQGFLKYLQKELGITTPLTQRGGRRRIGRVSEDGRNAIRSLNRQGLLDAAIAELLDISLVTTRRHRKSMGLRANGPSCALPQKTVEAIRQLHSEGLSDPKIAKRLGIGKTAVGRHRRSMGLLAWNPAPEKASPGTIKAIRQLHREGLDDTQISRCVGLSNSTVSSHRRALGLLPNSPIGTALSQEMVEAIRQLHSEGLNDARIAKRLGIGKTTVWTKRREMDLPPIPRGTWYLQD